VSRQTSLRSLLKISSSSLTSCISFAVLKIAVKMSCVISFYHFSFFLTFVNSKTCCQIFWCFRRSSAITLGMIVMTMLNFDWDIVTVTIMMLRFADLRTLLMLFLIEIKSSVLTTFVDVIVSISIECSVSWCNNEFWFAVLNSCLCEDF